MFTFDVYLILVLTVQIFRGFLSNATVFTRSFLHRFLELGNRQEAHLQLLQEALHHHSEAFQIRIILVQSENEESLRSSFQLIRSAPCIGMCTRGGPPQMTNPGVSKKEVPT